MNASATLNLTDYIVAIGNQFFNLDEKDWNVEQDELSYETTDRNGFNGYVLKIEEKADDYSNVIITKLISYLSLFYAFISKHIQKKKTEKDETQAQSRRYANTQTAINTRVRSRLLEVINEDVEKWSGQKVNYQKSKNQFRSSTESAITSHHSLFDYLGIRKSFPNKNSPIGR